MEMNDVVVRLGQVTEKVAYGTRGCEAVSAAIPVALRRSRFDRKRTQRFDLVEA